MRLIGVIAIVASALLCSCGNGGYADYPDYSYKMTIYADGNAFSTVRHVEDDRVRSWAIAPLSSGWIRKTKMQGEAVIIDLNGHTYYALLNNVKSEFGGFRFVTLAFRSVMPTKSKLEASYDDYQTDTPEEAQKLVKVSGPHDLPRRVESNGVGELETRPTFVTFDQPSDPTSLREVAPDDIGVSRITIEITDQPVTNSLSGRFNNEFWNKLWSKRSHKISEELRKGSLYKNPYFQTIEAKVDRDDFSQTEKMK